ncbi:hypothetical protein DFH08DRAFT_960378 [Mycena albidolilacea]|uniref:Uncharacterized protein n=1 Tax=Mycena albidolilacea TaxID=1033008 RepID=A0AAD7A279_9AGAR|nr:hypothetical protein DFH08DRAFT_960378 [Mycena albidolilacea]
MFVSPAAARTRTAARGGKHLTFLLLPAATRTSRSKIPNITPLEPVITKETAHAPLPHQRSFSSVAAESRFLEQPSSPTPLQSCRSPSMATYMEETPSIAPGMERGYTLSPMAELERNYSSHSESESSLFEHATSISSKWTLEATDILDRGVSLHPRLVVRFSLETGLLIRTEKTIKDMNTLLSRSSALVPGRITFSVIDPQYSFLRVLRSAGDMNQLLVTWQALSTRMDLAQRSLVKYQHKFRVLTRDEMPTSPVLTAPEVYNAFPEDGSPIVDVNYLYENVPHLQSVWPCNYEPGKVTVESVIRIPPHLSLAFPKRLAEEHPLTFYYTEDGTRVTLPSSIRSSHGTGPNFMPPPPETAGPSRRTHLQG